LYIARRDYLEFFIEKMILAMSGYVKKVSTLDFHVKWLGYDDKFNLWLPWKDLRETEIPHYYFRKYYSKEIYQSNGIASFEDFST
jgi:hypothetical protein